MLAKVRKAVVAGFGAGLAAGLGVLVEAGAPNREQVGKALGAFVVMAATVGWATYRVRNART